MGYIDEDGYFDLDNPDFADGYVFSFILDNLYPEGVDLTPEQRDLFPSYENKLMEFEYKLPKIKFPVSESEFINNKNLKKIADKYYSSIDKKVNMSALYYLTIYVYDLALRSTLNSFYIGEKRIDQLEKILTLKEKGDLEITFKSGKDKFVLTDEWLIDKMLSFSFSESDYNSLMGGDIDLNRKAEKFSYTDASSVFAFNMFKYYKRNNSAKELISNLIYISGLVTNDSIITSNDYINILLRNYKQIMDNEKKNQSINLTSNFS